MRIDAHHHVWRLARGDYGWLTSELGPIHRDFAMAELAPSLARHEITHTILVQAAPTEAETRFLLEVAAAEARVAGVVGWADFAGAGAAARIAAMAQNPLLVGLRPMVQDIPDDDWLLRPDLAEAFRALVANGLVFDALVLPRHLSRLLVLADRHPDLAIVVDHAAKPPIREGRLEPWASDMAALAQRPNVVCKLSGLVTEAGAGWAPSRLAPFVDHLLAVFGPGRLVWGSDWPVLKLAADYDVWMAASRLLLDGLTEDDRAAVFGRNAAWIYLSERGRRC